VRKKTHVQQKAFTCANKRRLAWEKSGRPRPTRPSRCTMISATSIVAFSASSMVRNVNGNLRVSTNSRSRPHAGLAPWRKTKPQPPHRSALQKISAPCRTCSITGCLLRRSSTAMPYQAHLSSETLRKCDSMRKARRGFY